MPALGYDPEDPLAAPAGSRGRRNTPEPVHSDLSDLASDGENWHRFRVLPHPDASEDHPAGDITIAVKHHGDVPDRPWGNSRHQTNPDDRRPLYEVRVMRGESQVIPDVRSGKGQGHPYWGSVTRVGDTTPFDVAKGVASSLGSDSYDIDAPLEHRGLYDPDQGHTEENYPWSFGRGSSDFANDFYDGSHERGNSVAYSDREKDFLRQHGDQLAFAGREPYPYEREEDEPETLVEEHLPETRSGDSRPYDPRTPRGRYGKNKAAYEAKIRLKQGHPLHVEK